jgi:hypothetical protein
MYKPVVRWDQTTGALCVAMSPAPDARCGADGSALPACIVGRARLGARALRPDLAGDRQARHLLGPRLLPRHLQARLRVERAATVSQPYLFMADLWQTYYHRVSGLHPQRFRPTCKPLMATGHTWS